MVVISHTHEFIFLETRKTAGTSVEMLLEPLCTPAGHVVKEKTAALVSRFGVVGRRLTEPPTSRGIARVFTTDWHNHMPAAEVRRALGRRRWNRYRKVSTVRNPFDRMVSQFHYRMRNEPLQERDFSELRADFRDFVLHGKWPNDYRIVHCNGQFVIDHAIRFESIQQDIEDFLSVMGIDGYRAQLPLTKSTAAARKSRPVADYFDRETIDAVRKKLSWVFEHFEYPEAPDAVLQSSGNMEPTT